MNLTGHFRAVKMAYDDVKKRDLRDIKYLIELAQVKIKIARLENGNPEYSQSQLTEAAAAIIRAMELNQIVIDASRIPQALSRFCDNPYCPHNAGERCSANALFMEGCSRRVSEP